MPLVLGLEQPPLTVRAMEERHAPTSYEPKGRLKLLALFMCGRPQKANRYHDRGRVSSH